MPAFLSSTTSPFNCGSFYLLVVRGESGHETHGMAPMKQQQTLFAYDFLIILFTVDESLSFVAQVNNYYTMTPIIKASIVCFVH
jgi:hypothetical protein